MYKVIFCAALCALNMYGMKQKQLIEKVIKHKRGLFCLDKILKYTEYRGTNYPSIIDSGKDLTDFLNESIRTKPHWFYDEIAHNPTGRLIYDPSVIY